MANEISPMRATPSTLLLLMGDGDLRYGANKNTTTLTPAIIKSVYGKDGRAFRLESNSIVATNGLAGLSADFTLDWWEYSLAESSAGATLFTAGDFTLADLAGIKDKVAEVWVHWAITKSGTTYTSYKNGVEFAVVEDSTVFNFGNNFTLNSGEYNADIERFRVSNGVLYTGAFTPPVKAEYFEKQLMLFKSGNKYYSVENGVLVEKPVVEPLTVAQIVEHGVVDIGGVDWSALTSDVEVFVWTMGMELPILSACYSKNVGVRMVRKGGV